MRAVAWLAAVTALAPALASAASGLPQPAVIDNLAGISCLSLADCWAVGYAQDQNNNSVAEALHWDGVVWTAAPIPAIAGALSAVNCTSSHDCFAIGESPSNGNTAPRGLIVHWNGASWTRSPTAQMPSMFLQDISCAGLRCMAVGTYKRTRLTLALRFNGSKWAQVKTPDPNTKWGAALDAVSCTSARNCWAFGSYYGPPLKPTPAGYLFAARWNGSAWKLAWTSTPYPGGDITTSFKPQLRCFSSSDCWAVTDVELSPVLSYLRIMHWNGHNWKTVTRPPKRINVYQYVSGFACSSSHNCVAVGSSGFTNAKPFALHFNGSSWTPMRPPSVSSGQVNAIACPSAGECWAVGDHSDTDGSQANVALLWDGDKWSGY